MFGKLKKFFGKRVCLNSFTHLALGIGIGLLLYQYVTDWMPLLGGGLVLLGVLIHLYGLMSK
ncbi:MAG: hypothetical protein ACK4MM_06055 [Fervidobacterium sp.]